MAASASSVVMPVLEAGHMGAVHEGGYLYSHSFNKNSGMRCTVSEIEEESFSDLFEIGQSGSVAVPGKEDVSESSLFSYDIHRGGEVEDEDCVYVAVGKEDSSMDALMWTLRNIQAISATMTTTIYLVHVFPETHFIPSPLGNLPISSVSAEQAETHKMQETVKRREMLQKFVNTCNAYNFKVDTILIESGMVEKAILDLIPVLNIRQLVLGTPRSSLRRLRSKRGNGIAGILQKAPETCKVKIICDGKEVVLDQTITESPARTPVGNEEGSDCTKQGEEENQCRDYFSCLCFKPKTL
ncbi:U-box domain-containing protein 35-like [Punica granatum]|uniref:Uncharacterized protein n=2 Tax=Punica granatum TaxID=22663 RepID=A0A218XEG7_PUNGR|nr:U-box domain-containing protein 35-like [Punica granatum]OWM83334.1 hypothetical protein CDL15_Pgr012815 [Punica granatum]PKI66418.1 hypothetical protein CRG98_013220 [Punica granatum]